MLTRRHDVRRLVTPLLAVGSVLLVAALIWPTERMVMGTGQDAVPLLDIWLWGRVRSLSEMSSTDLDGSFGTLAVLALSAVLAVVAGVLWALTTRRPAPERRLRGTVAAATAAAALATAAVGLTVMTAGLGFGWYAYGVPTFTRTLVAGFPPVAIAVWAVALAFMLGLLLRPGPGEAPVDPSAG